MSHKVSHKDSISVYTDGSKTDHGVGASAVFPDLVISHTLPTYTSIFSAELIAIAMAVSGICDLPPDCAYTIFSDSRSALLALLDRSSKNPLVSAVQKLISSAQMTRRGIAFCWVPSHVGVQGNELADTEAKSAATGRVTCRRYLPPDILLGHLPATDLYASIRRGFLSCWGSCWVEDSRGAKLRTVKPLIGHWPSSCRRSRRLEVILARLRIGHTNLTHGYLMKRESPPSCPFCHSCDLTIAHIFVGCDAISAIRRRFFPDVLTIPFQNRLAYMLSDSPHFSSDTVFAFLHELNIFYKI